MAKLIQIVLLNELNEIGSSFPILVNNSFCLMIAW